MPPVSPPVLLLKASTYSGTGVWHDESGNDTDATLTTGVIKKNADGNGIVLNGYTNWTFPNVALEDSWTINVWYKDLHDGPYSSTSGTILTQAQVSGGAVNVNLEINSNSINVNAYNSSWTSYTGPNREYNTWVNLQATWDGSTLNFYKNGKSFGTSSFGTTVDGGNQYYIGSSWNGGEFVKGEIGEIRMYNYAISQEQVSADYISSYETFMWQPISISGLSLWFDSAEETTIDLSGSTVTQWRDKSGLNKNTTTVVGTPTFTPGTGVTFDGSSYFNLPNGSLPYGDSSYSIYVVFNAVSGSSGIIGGGSLTTVSSYGLIAYDDNTVQTAWNSNIINTSETYTFEEMTLTNSLYQSGGQRTVFLSGIEAGSDTPGTRTQTNTNNTLGAAPNVPNMNGIISEVLVYNTNHTTIQRQIVEGYLAWKWGLTLPIIHPFYSRPPNVNESQIGLMVLLKASDYSGSGSWLDQSGQGRNATLENGIIAKNVQGNGIILNSATNWTFPNVAVGNRWTVSVWYKNTGPPTGSGSSILTQKNTGGQINLSIGDNDIGQTSQINSSFLNDAWYRGSTVQLVNKQWINIQVTWDGTTMTTYINGVLLGTTTPGGTAVDSGQSYRIGRRWDDNAWYVTGEIGEVRIYNYPILANKVLADYEASAPTFLWQPTVVTGLKFWLDANDQASLDLSGSTVTQWNDKSGQSNDAVAVGTPQVSSGSITFNGSTDYFTTTYTAHSAAESVFIVYKLNAITETNSLIESSVNGGRQFKDTGSNGVNLYRAGQGVLATGTINSATTGVNILSECLYDLSGINLYSNGTLSVSNSTNPAFTAGVTLIGGNPLGGYLDGSISEVLIYNRTLTEHQRQIVEGYLVWKWGLQASLPTVHPFKTHPPSVNESATGLMILLKASTYSGTGAWLDESGQGRNATLEDGIIAKNSQGNGINLNGGTSWTFPNVGVGNAFTASVWYKNTGGLQAYSAILTQIDDGISVNIGIGNSSGDATTIYCNFSPNYWNTGLNISPYLPIGKWVNIQMTWDGTTINVYINGVLLSTATPAGPPQDNGLAYRIGRGWNSSSYVTGEIGEIRIYNYAIDQAKVTADYLSSAPIFVWQLTQISGLQLWLDGADPNGNYSPSVDASTLTTWADNSGYSSNAIAAVGTTIIKNAIKNGLSVVRMDGSQRMDLTLPSSLSTYTIFTVQWCSGNGGSWQRLLNGTPNNILLFGIQSNTTNVFTTTGYNSSFDDLNANSPSYDNNQVWRLVSMLVDVSGVQSYVDGNAQVVRNKSSAALSAINIGSEDTGVTESWRGDIGEILIYNGVVSQPQRYAIEGYLAWKWGLQTSLPSSHPFYSLPPLPNQSMSGLQVLLKASDYSGTGAWLDQSGKGRNATLENGTIAKNAQGNGIVLNGSTNWTFPNVAVGNQWTASVWYKNTGDELGGASTILTQLYNNGINLSIGNNDAYAQSSRQINGAFVTPAAWYRGSNVQLLDNQWTNIQVTWDGTTMKTYINSVLLGSTTPGGTAVDSGLAYRIGRRWDYNAWYVTGEIGEVRIYNYAISQSQVSADYLSSYQTYAWTPTSITGLRLWFDGSDQSTIDLSGSKVTQWRDKSGLNKNTTTVTGTPTFTPGAGVIFDGSSSFALPNGSIPFGDSSYSIYVVLRTSVSANNGIIGGGAQVNNQYLGCRINTDDTIMNSWNTNDITSSGTFTVGQSFLAEYLYQSGGQRSLFISGSASGSDTPGTRNQPNTGNTLGRAGSFMNGLISEVLVYNTNHTQSQRQVVEGYLAWKWGLSLSSTHPFYKQPPSVNQNLIGLQVQLKASTYSGSGLWLDESGFNRNAVMTQGAIAKNVTGNGIYLDGSTRWTFPNVAVGNAWSVNIWFKQKGAGNGLLGQGLAGYMNMNILNDQSNVGFYSGGWYYGSNITLRQGVWTNIQVTWDGTNMITYINGILLGSVPLGGTSLDGDMPYYIGKSWQDSTSNGDIGEVSIWNYPISQSQVTANYTSSVYTYVWQPIQLTGLKLWLDGADQESLDLSGSTVTQWNDKSGLNNNGVASGAPQVLNNSIVFNGSTDYFTIPYTSQAAAETMFVVFKPSTTDQSGLVDTTVYNGRAFQYQASTLHLFNSGIMSYIDGATTLSVDTTYIAECSYSSAGSTLYVSGNQDGTNGTNATFGGNGTTLIGAGYYNPSTPVGFYLNGTISEVIIYNRVLTPVQRQIVEGYLAWKWGLQLPSTHIFYSRSPNANEPQNGLMVLLKAVDYSGSGAWLDESEQNCNATLENGQIAKNVGGNGIVLNGYTSWTFPNVAVGNQWTASVWYKNTGDENGGASTILTQILNNAINLSIGTNDLFVASSRQIIGGFLSSVWYRGSTVQLLDNQWTNIQVTWDGTNMKTYINGVLLGTTTPGGIAVDSGRAYIIGRRWDAIWYVKGEIGEVRIYNYAITHSQVIADYQASVPTFLWNPTQISGLQLWLDGNDQTSLALSGSSVTRWNDKSGLNNNTTTVTGTPTFSASGVGFDGSSYFGLPDGSIPYGDSSYSIYAVINFAGPDVANYNVFGCGNLDVANSSLGIQNSGSNICVFWGGNNLTTTTAFTFTQPFVFGTSYKSGSIRTTFSNGTSIGTDTPGIARVQIPTSNYLGTWMPGIGTPMLGTISEVIIYNTTLTKHQRQLVEGYLAWKWSLQSQLPSSHPFYTRSPIYNESQTGLLVLFNAVDYSGSGPWLDQSGYGRNATKSAGTIAKNAEGNGIVLDGSTYWTFPNIAAGNMWTISVWYKDASSGVYPASQCIVTQEQAGTSTQVNIALTFALGPSGQCRIGQYNGDWNIGPAATINNNWTNIQATWNGTTVKLYKNGALVGTANFNNVPSIDGGDPYFIGRQWNADNFIRGEIGEVRIYNYALIQDDLLVEYLEGLPIFLLHPTSISGCQLWFDGADTSSLTFNSNTVTQWADKSGLNNNTTTVTGTPTYTLGSGVVFNGTSCFILPDGSIPYGDSSYSIYIVAKVNTGDSKGFIGGGSQAANESLSVFYLPSTGSTHTRWFSNDINTSAVIALDTLYLAESLYQSGGKRTLFINANADSSDTPGTRSQTNTGNVLGGITPLYYYMDGTISEVLVYNTNHSKRQRQIVEGYLAWKWGLQAQLPSGHLFYNRSPTLNESLTSPVILLKAVNYSGSGTWYDNSGYGRNATLENGTAAKNTQGNGIVLDGSTNWTFPNVAVGNAWTASVWYKNTGDEIGGASTILTQIYGTPGINLLIGNSDLYATTSRQINGAFLIPGTWYNGSTAQLIDNQWTNIQVTWDGTNMTTYVNGVLLGTTTPGGTAVDSGQAYRIGGHWNSPYYMTGEIGEVRIYDYPLTQAQVRADYQESYSTFIIPVILLKASTYSGSGPWNDETVNGNYATLENGTIQKNADGNGIVLDGSTSWTFPNIALGNKWTLNVWYKNIAGIPSGSAIITQLMSNYSLNLQLGGFSGGLTVGFYEGGISSDIQFLLVTNNWINIQATWDGTDLCVYINGILIGTTQPGGTAVDNGQDYRIGAGWDSDTYVTGEIGEVRIYNFPLTQYQVTVDYQESAPAFIWQPTSIPDLQLWLDANDYNTLDLSGSNVTQWNDKSGNDNTIVGNGYPVFQSVNNLPTVNFNNELSSSLYLPSTIMNTANAYSIVLAYMPNVTGNLIMTNTQNGLSNTNNLSTYYTISNGNYALGTPGILYWNPNNTLQASSISAVVSLSTIQLVEIIFDGTVLNMFTNGSNCGSFVGDYSLPVKTTQTILGNYDTLVPTTDFNIYEFLYYNNAALSLKQRQNVEGYLSWKWGVPLSLTHPYYQDSPYIIPPCIISSINIRKCESYNGNSGVIDVFPSTITYLTISSCIVTQDSAELIARQMESCPHGGTLTILKQSTTTLLLQSTLSTLVGPPYLWTVM